MTRKFWKIIKNGWEMAQIKARTYGYPVIVHFDFKKYKKKIQSCFLTDFSPFLVIQSNISLKK